MGSPGGIAPGNLPSCASPQLLEAEPWPNGAVSWVARHGPECRGRTGPSAAAGGPRRNLEGFGTGIEGLQRTAALLQSSQSPERWVEPGPSRKSRGTLPTEPHRLVRPGEEGFQSAVLPATAPRCWPRCRHEGGAFRAAAESRRQRARPAGAAAAPPTGACGRAPRGHG